MSEPVDRLNLSPLRRLIVAAGDRDGDEFVLFGSAVLLLHGLREEIGDVDVMATPRLYVSLYREQAPYPGLPPEAGVRTDAWRIRKPHPTDPPFLEGTNVGPSVPVHVFYDWTPRDREWMTSAGLFEAREWVRGWPCASLEEVRRHKRGALDNLMQRGAQITGTPYEKHARDLDLLDRVLG